MSALVVDTHALVWYIANDARLSQTAAAVIDDHDASIIAATAKALGLPLVTRDTRLVASEVETIW